MNTLTVVGLLAVCLVVVMASPEPEADPGYRRGIGSHGNFRGSHGSRYGGYSGHSHGGYSNYGYKRGKRSADPEAVAEADAEPSYGYNPYNSRRSYPVTSYSSSGSYGYGGRWKRSADPEAAADADAEPSYGYNPYNSRRSYPVTSYSSSGSYGRRGKRSADPKAAGDAEAGYGYNSYSLRKTFISPPVYSSYNSHRLWKRSADAEPSYSRRHNSGGYNAGHRGFHNRGLGYQNFGYDYGY